MRLCDLCEMEIAEGEQTADGGCPHCNGEAPAKPSQEKRSVILDTLDLSSAAASKARPTQGTHATTGLVTDGTSPKHEVGNLLARGGMGLVFDARDANVRRQVAMKIMRKDKALDQSALVRFVEEAQITGQLEHPNIVPVYELGVDKNDSTYYTMKLVSGLTLAEVLSKVKKGDATIIERFPLVALLDVFLKVCDAIDYAHDKGVIHRDLKPSNIMIGDYGEALVVDWGLAKVYIKNEDSEHALAEAFEKPQAVERAVESIRTAEDGSFHTIVGQVMGTPGFMAPEQAMGLTYALDQRTDVFALGAILYNILSLKPAFHAGSSAELIRKVLVESPTPLPEHPDWKCPHLPNGRIPDGLKAVALKALERRAEDRYHSAGELSRDVRAWMSGFATLAEEASFSRQLYLLVKRRKKEFAFAAAAVVLMLGMLTSFVVRLNHEKRTAQGERDRAQRAEESAREERNAAVAAESRATEEERKAKDSLKLATESKALAEKARIKAESENYFSTIGLVQSRIQSGLYHQAESMLWDLPKTQRHWEWGWLMRECTLAAFTFPVKTHKEWTGLATSVDGQWVATPAKDGTVRIWSVSKGEMDRDLKGECGRVTAVAFSPDGKRLVAAGEDDSIVVWSVDPWKVERRLTGHYSDVLHLAFSADGKKMASSGLDGCTKVWDISDWTVKLNLTGHPAATGAAFMPDGNGLVTIGDEGKVFLWSLAPAKRLLSINLGIGALRAVHVSPDGRTVAVAGDGDLIHVLNPKTGVGLYRLASNKGVNTIDISQNGQYLAAGDDTGMVSVWQLRDGRKVGTYKGHSDAVTGVTFALDGKFLLSASKGGRVKAWSVLGTERLRTFPGRAPMVGTAKFFSGNDRIVEATRRRRLSLVDPITLRPEKTIEPLSVMVKDMAVDWVKQRAMIIGLHGHGLMLDLQSRKVLFQFGSNNGDCRSAGAMSADGRLIATLDMFSPEIRFWDGNAGNELMTLTGHDKRCNALCFSPDGSRLVTTCFNGEVGFWDVTDGKQLKVTKAHMGIAECVAFSPDGKFFVTGGEDGHIHVWDGETGTPLQTMKGHIGSVLHVNFSTDGKRLVSVALDNVMRIWDAESWRELAALRRSDDPKRFDRHMYREMMSLMKVATFSQDMRHIVTDIPEVWTAVDPLADREEFHKSKHRRFLKAYYK